MRHVTQPTVLLVIVFRESNTVLCLSVNQLDNARRLISYKDIEQGVRGLKHSVIVNTKGLNQ
jgi:hypothetical protein